MGCIIGYNKDKTIDINNMINETDSKHFIVNNSKNDINNYLNEQSSINITNNNNKTNLDVTNNTKKISFNDDITKNDSSLNLRNNNNTQILKPEVLSPKDSENNINLIITITNESNITIDKLTLINNILSSEKKNINIQYNNNIITFGSSVISKDDQIYYKNINYKISDTNIKPHQFDIEILNNKYFIKDYKDGSGIFLKINPKLLITENNSKLVFSLNNYLYLKTEIKFSSSQIFINFKKKKINFNFKEKKIIRIGRSEDCDIKITEEPGISRVQISFIYNEKNNELYAYDGNVINENEDVNNKQSTNGVWLLIDKMEIFDKMIIKSGMTKFFFELTNI